MEQTPNYEWDIPDDPKSFYAQLRLTLIDIDADLFGVAPPGSVALADPGGNGIVVRTALGTTTPRSLTQPAAGFTISNNDGVAGNPTFALANDLAALEGLTGTGIARRTGTSTWALDSTAYITNSASVGVLPKTIDGDGNLGDSRFIDGGTGNDITIGGGTGFIFKYDETLQTLLLGDVVNDTQSLLTIELGGDFHFDNASVVIHQSLTVDGDLHVITDAEFTSGAAIASGGLRFHGSTSGVVTIQPAAVAGTWTLTLPPDDGASGQVLTTNGAGVTSWTTPAAAGANTALSNLASVAINTSLLLGTSDGGALGSATKMWSDLFLASGAVINFNNGNMALTHSAAALTVSGGGGGALVVDVALTVNSDVVIGGALEATAISLVGATSGVVTIQPADVAGTWTLTLPTNDGTSGQVLTTDGAGVTSWTTVTSGGGGGASTALDNLASVAINASLLPGTSDAVALGSTTKQWSDLFLAEGGVINWDNGDATLTQVNNVLTLAGAEFVADHVTVNGLIKAGTTPTTLTDSTGKILSAALNTVAVAQGGTGDTGTAWTPYTPTVSAGTGTFTTVTATGRYKQIGKTVFVRIKIAITTNGTAASYVKASMPVAGSNTDSPQAFCGQEFAVTGKGLVGAFYPDTSTMYITFSNDGSYPGGDGRELYMQGVYEAQ